MLHLHHSNRFERLADGLLAQLDGPREDPFQADTVIVPSAAVQRALTLAIADRHGICARVEFSFLAPWLWDQMRRVLPALAAQSPFAPAVLAWRVHGLLADPGIAASAPRLAHYLAGADDVMRYELARRIAALLEQASSYRADWLPAWAAGRTVLPAGMPGAADEPWLAALWQRLATLPGIGAVHPGPQAVRALAAARPAAVAAVAPRPVHVLAPASLAPLHGDLLAALARHQDVHVHVLDPCREYWTELVAPRRLAALARRGQAAGHEVGNRHLAAWGGQTQALIDGLLARSGDDVVDHQDFEPSPGETLLARWQNAVLDSVELMPGSVTPPAGDRSVELHVCHSPTRELEVLQDRLLGLFAGDEPPAPGRVLVVLPDLEAAAPLIDAVFGTAPPERRIPYTITGRARSRVNVPARALLALLDLAAGRCPASELFAVMQQPIVARRLGLDDDGLGRLHTALQASGLRWGLDAAHRAAQGLPADPRHTLVDALDRLFLGHALPADGDAEPLAGLLPAGDLEGADALLLGALHRYAALLRQLHDAASMPQTPARWHAQLQAWLRAALAPADDERDDLSELHDTLQALFDGLARAEQGMPLPLAVLRRALELALDDPARGGVPGGSVAFSAMSPLRGLPYDVVCLLGLDDGAFPVSDRPAEFDLLAAQPRRGDRQRRQDDRNLFLDLLLAARRAVHLSHTGRSVRDNAPLPPSVLVSEWLDVLVPAIATDPLDDDERARARAALVIEHPLQPFAEAAFRSDADVRLRSHQQDLCAALQARHVRHVRHVRHEAAAPGGPADGAEHADDHGDVEDDTDDHGAYATAWAPPMPFFTAPLSPPGAAWRAVTLTQLIRFFASPARALLRERLRLHLPRAEEELQDDEAFVPDRPAQWAVADRLWPALLAGAAPARLFALAAAGTDWPAGPLGDAPLRALIAQLSTLAAGVRAATAAPPAPPHAATVTLDLDGEPWQVSHGYADLRADGLVRWRLATLRPRDRLEAWLLHLLLAAAPPPGGAMPTRWLAQDQILTLRPPEPEAARQLLADLLRLYRRGLAEPLPFFPNAGWACVESGGNVDVARRSWQPSRHHPRAEGADDAVRLAWRGHPDPLGGDFAAIAAAVFDPLRAHTNEAG